MENSHQWQTLDFTLMQSDGLFSHHEKSWNSWPYEYSNNEVFFYFDFHHRALNDKQTDCFRMSCKPYIVLLGDVGSGKSTIVEKLTGEKGRSSAASQSETLISAVFETHDGSLIIADTPGSNAMADQFTHNLHIANAMNFLPVTCILIVVKADIRIDNVVKTITKYAEGIPEEFPTEQISVCVTHMDHVSWSDNEFLQQMTNELGIDTAVFCSLETETETLKNDFLSICAERSPVELSIDGEAFLSTFDLDSRDSKVLHESRKEVALFQKMKQDFYLHTQNTEYTRELSILLVFDFQQIMLDEIILAQKRLSANNNFGNCEGPQIASEAGYIADMTNQIGKVLRSVTVEAENYIIEFETNFRQCPYCSTVWQNADGCEGVKTCGNKVLANNLKGIVQQKSTKMSTFKYLWDCDSETLTIELLDNHEKNTLLCGNSIQWSLMAPVRIPEEILRSLPENQNDEATNFAEGQGRLLYITRFLCGLLTRVWRCVWRRNDRISAEAATHSIQDSVASLISPSAVACENTTESTVVQVEERDMESRIMNAYCTIF